MGKEKICPEHVSEHVEKKYATHKWGPRAYSGSGSILLESRCCHRNWCQGFKVIQIKKTKKAMVVCEGCKGTGKIEALRPA